MFRALAVASGVGLIASGALAAAPELVWEGPECVGSGPQFESRLAALISPTERARLAGRVGVRARGNRFDLTLSLELGGVALGERRLEVKDCQAAAETAAVAASLAVFSAESPAPAAAPAATVAPEPQRRDAWTRGPEPRPDFTRQRPLAPPRATAPELRAGLLGVVDAGALPAPALGAALELGVGFGRFSTALIGATSLEQIRTAPGGSARLRLSSFAVRACYAPLASGLVRLDACGGARLLGTHGQGRDFDVNYQGALFGLGPLLGLDLSVRAPAPLEWRFELEACAPLSRQRFTVREQEVARLDAVTFSGRLGPVVRF